MQTERWTHMTHIWKSCSLLRALVCSWRPWGRRFWCTLILRSPWTSEYQALIHIGNNYEQMFTFSKTMQNLRPFILLGWWSIYHPFTHHYTIHLPIIIQYHHYESFTGHFHVHRRGPHLTALQKDRSGKPWDLPWLRRAVRWWPVLWPGSSGSEEVSYGKWPFNG